MTLWIVIEMAEMACIEWWRIGHTKWHASNDEELDIRFISKSFILTIPNFHLNYTLPNPTLLPYVYLPLPPLGSFHPPLWVRLAECPGMEYVFSELRLQIAQMYSCSAALSVYIIYPFGTSIFHIIVNTRVFFNVSSGAASLVPT